MKTKIAVLGLALLLAPCVASAGVIFSDSGSFDMTGYSTTFVSAAPGTSNAFSVGTGVFGPIQPYIWWHSFFGTNTGHLLVDVFATDPTRVWDPDTDGPLTSFNWSITGFYHFGNTSLNYQLFPILRQGAVTSISSDSLVFTGAPFVPSSFSKTYTPADFPSINFTSGDPIEFGFRASAGYEFQSSFNHWDSGQAVSSFAVTSVPEPSTLALAGTGAMGLGAVFMARRRRLRRPARS